MVDHEPEIHARLIHCFEDSQRELDEAKKRNPITYKEKELLQPMSFRSVPADYAFIEKKPPSEFVNTDGILKHNWPSKHFDSIPSVLVYVIPFGIEWSATEFNRRETAIQERYSRFRSLLGSRDIKIIVICVRVGLGYIDKEVIDDRTSMIKRHAQLDTKNFLYLHTNEVTSDNVSLKRMHRQLRDYCYGYYSSNIKRFKTIEKGLAEKWKGLPEQILSARYNFKIAYLNEFTGHRNYMIKYYRNAYTVLLDVLENVDEELYEQAKCIAEYCHFKLVNLYLMIGQYDDAIQQFKIHAAGFQKIYSELPWKHYSWLADQYLIMAQIVAQYKLQDIAVTAAEPIAGGSQLSGELDLPFYYLSAAKYTQKRETSFEKARSGASSKSLSPSPGGGSGAKATGQAGRPVSQGVVKGTGTGIEEYKGMVFMPPKYLGAPPQLLDPVLDSMQPGSEDSVRLYHNYLHDQECVVAHNPLVCGFLHTALSLIPANQQRRKLFIYMQLGDQHLKHGRVALALVYYWHCLASVQHDRWTGLEVQMLRQIIRCATVLGRMKDYFLAALLLYAHGDVYRYEREDLHLNIRALVAQTLGTYPLPDARSQARCPIPNLDADPLVRSEAEEDPTESAHEVDLKLAQAKGLVHDRASFVTTSFTALMHRMDFASFAQQDPRGGEVDPDLVPGLPSAEISICGNTLTLYGEDMSLLNQQTSLPPCYRLILPGLETSPSLGNSVSSVPLSVTVTYSRLTVELGQEFSVRVAIHSQFLDTMVFRRLTLHFSEDVFQYTFPDAEIIVRPGSGPNTNVWSTSFRVTEDVFGALLNPDSAFYLSAVELLWKAEEEEEEEDGAASRSVALVVPALPSIALEELQRRGSVRVKKPPARESLSFHAAHALPRERDRFRFVTITKPSELLSVVSPLPDAATTLLYGLVQRVDVTIRIGDQPLHNAKVYLSNDLGGSVLFYTPAYAHLSLSSSSTNKEGGEEGVNVAAIQDSDVIAFHPYLLSASLQPASPLHLPPILAPHSLITVPVFLCVGGQTTPSSLASPSLVLPPPPPEQHVKATMKLMLDFVPQGIMHSNVTRELTFPLHIMRPFQTSLVLYSTPGSGNTVPSSSTAAQGSSAEGDTSSPFSSQMDGRESWYDQQTRWALHLKYLHQDAPAVVLRHALHRQDGTVEEISTASPHREGGGVVLQGQECMATSFAPCAGKVHAHWRLRDHHPLRRVEAAVGGSTAAAAATQRVQVLLPVAGSHPTEKEYSSCVDVSTCVYNVACVSLPVPEVRERDPPLTASLHAPLSVVMLAPFTIQLTLRNTLPTAERVELTVFLNESFLLSGPTRVTVEIAGRTEEVVELSAIALRPGQVALPQIRAVWKRVDVKLLDAGDKESTRRVLFVEPCAVNRSTAV